VNRIQRVRRFRLASLALSLGAVLAVSSFPAATFAASGDSIQLSPSAITAGSNGSSFTVAVTATTTQAYTGVAASITFDKAALKLTSAAYAATDWGTLPIKPVDLTLAQTFTDANAAGKLNGVTAGSLGATIPAGAGKAFFSATFQVISCPTSGQLTLGLPAWPGTGGFVDAGFDNNGTSITASTTGASVTCTPPAPNEFSINAAPTSVTVPQGGTGQTTISTTYTSGTAEAVTLGTSGVPANVTATFASPTVTPTGGTSLTFSVAAAAVVGSYPITVAGTSASVPTPGHTVVVTLIVVPPPAGPSPATGQTTISGTVDQGYLGVSVQANTSLRLRRNAPNEVDVPVLIFSNTQWTLSVGDAAFSTKAVPDRGHMLDTGASPVKRLTNPMQAFVPVASPAVPLVRTLDQAASLSLTSGALGATVPVALTQQTTATDAPGNYAIDLVFSAISGF
jgi:hypothetical protein